MLNEVLKISSPESDKNFIDCTFGGGGYARNLKFPKTNVQAIDRDVLSVANELEKISKRLNFFK